MWATESNNMCYETTAALFESWDCYCRDNLLYPISVKAFALYLKDLGFDQIKRVPGTLVRGFVGIKLRVPTTPNAKAREISGHRSEATAERIYDRRRIRKGEAVE